MKTLIILLSIMFTSSMFAQDINLKWAKRIGGGAYDGAESIKVDKDGNVYTTGYYEGTVDFDPGKGASILSSKGGKDIFISKLDSLGNFIWAKSIGGATSDIVKSITVDGEGNVYTTGYFNGKADFDPGKGVYNLTSVGVYDIFISKLDALGNFKWAKRIGGTEWDAGYSLSVDKKGNVYTTGFLTGIVDFDPGKGIFNLGLKRYQSGFVSKLDASGNFVWAKSFKYTRGHSIALDVNENVYTTGFFIGEVDFDPGKGVYNLKSSGGQETFISKLDKSGNFVWAKQMGGVKDNTGKSIALDNKGNVIVLGGFIGSVDFNPGKGVFILISQGRSDIYLSKLTSSGAFIWAKKMGGSGSEQPSSLAISNKGDVYATGTFNGTVDFDPGVKVFNLKPIGSVNYFMVKLNSTGNFVWANNFFGQGISSTTDDRGNVYTTGSFVGTVDVDLRKGVFNLTSAGGHDIFILKMGPCSKINVLTKTNGPKITAMQNGANYQWLNCDKNYTKIVGATKQVFVAATTGNYAVEINNGGCIDTSDCVGVIGVGIKEDLLGLTINVFPNPTDGNITIDLESITHTKVSIVSVTGKSVFQLKYLPKRRLNISLAHLQRGVYFIKVSSNNQQRVIKLIKQ